MVVLQFNTVRYNRDKTVPEFLRPAYPAATEGHDTEIWCGISVLVFCPSG